MGRPLSTAEFAASADYEAKVRPGTSVFDPVLAEAAYRWWCPPGGSVLDPFAGGSTRGAVAAHLGLRYTGVDLRADQVEANDRCPAVQSLPKKARPSWLVGDAAALPAEAGDGHDFILSCPPYHDLEVYSDDERDLSTLGWADFLVAYRQAIDLAAVRLAPNRFAAWVIGEVRDPAGRLRGLVPATFDAFASAGLAPHDEAVLVTPAGALALRAGRSFSTRKIARCHQVLLVFCKGDPATAAEAVGR